MQYSKWQSRRWIVTVWSMLLLSIVSLYSLINVRDVNWLGILLPILGTVPTAYISWDSWGKKNNKGE